MGKQNVKKHGIVSAIKGKKTPPKKVTKDSDEDSSSPSSSEEEVGTSLQQTPVKRKQQTPVTMKQQTPVKKKQQTPDKIASTTKQPVQQLGVTTGRKRTRDEDSSSEEEDDSEEEEAPKLTKQTSPQKKQAVHQVGTKAVGQKAQVEESSSEEEDSDDDDSEDEDSDEDEEEKSKSAKQISQQKNQVHQVSTKAAGQKAQVAESSSEEEDEDDSEEDDSDEDDSKGEKEAPKSVKPVPQQKRQAASKQAQVEDSEEDDSSEDEEEDSSEDEEEDKIPPGKRAQVTKSTNGVKTMTKTSADDSDSDEEDEESEEEEDSEDEEEEETVMVQGMQKRKGDKIKGQPAAKKQKRKGDEADSNDEETETVKVPESKKRKKKEVKKESTSKKPKREAANGSEGTITLYVGHLGKSTTEDEITNFFSKNSINVVEVRKPPNKTNAFVDLEDAGDLQNALALNGSAFKNTTIAVEKAKPRAPAQAKQDQKTPPGTSPGNTSNKSENEKDSRTLFVKNLPDNATSDGLRSFFDSAVDIRIPQRDGVHKGFGFIEFADKKTMAAAMSERQGVEFNGNALYLDYMGSRSSFKKQHTSPGGTQGRGGGRQVSSGSKGESKILFVKNLSYSTDESSLKAAFKGAVSARIPTFQDSGKSKGFAFVDFPTAEAAAKAFDAMSGQAIDGRQVTLDFAIDKSAGGGGGRGGFGPRGRGGRNGGRGFRGGAAGGQRGRGGFGKAKGGPAQPHGKKIIFSKDSD